MARKIVVDPAKLRTAAEKMDAQAGEYTKQYTQLFSEVDGMGSAWQGVDNQAFVTQIKGYMDDFEKMVALMKQYSEFLRASAKTYEDTQTDITNSARKLVN